MGPVLKPKGSVFNARTVTAPIAAIVMAGLLYTYSVTSIRAAKRNAQLHREADGGQLDMRKESLRRHGVLGKVPRTGGAELFRDVGREAPEEGKKSGKGKVGGPIAVAEEEQGRDGRTGVEKSLEGYKGRGNAIERFREERPRLQAEED